MRDHPEGIRSVVLDSGLPTTYTIPGNWRNTHAGFSNLFQACAAETDCNAAHPHLEETFTGLVNKFESQPQTTTVRDPQRYDQSVQNYTACLSANGNNVKTCEGKRLIMETNERALSSISASIPGNGINMNSNSTVTVQGR